MWFQCSRDRGNECRYGLGKSQVFIGLPVWFKLALMCCVLEHDNCSCYCSPVFPLVSNSCWRRCLLFNLAASLAQEGAGLAQWWERLPPTNAYVARVRFLPVAAYGLSLSLVLTLLRGFFASFSGFPPFSFPTSHRLTSPKPTSRLLP